MRAHRPAGEYPALGQAVGVPADAALARSRCALAGYDPDAWSLRHPGVTLARVPGGEVAFWNNDDVVPLWEHWLPEARRVLASGMVP